jgi:hypothetical protein
MHEAGGKNRERGKRACPKEERDGIAHGTFLSREAVRKCATNIARIYDDFIQKVCSNVAEIYKPDPTKLKIIFI